MAKRSRSRSRRSSASRFPKALRPGRFIAFLTIIGALAIGAFLLLLPEKTVPLQERQEALQIAKRIRLASDAPQLLALPDNESKQITSLLDAAKRLPYGQFRWNPAGASTKAPVWLRIDLKANVLSVFRGGDEIGSGAIVQGMDGQPPPIGKFPILGMFRNYQAMTVRREMPFSIWLTDQGQYIHGSHVRSAAASHGSIGIPPAFAAMIFSAAHVGDPVYITQQ